MLTKIINDYCKSISDKTVKIDSIECIDIAEFLELCSELDNLIVRKHLTHLI
ncbi:hypothetical protein [Clostridium sp. ZBS18]|uniref:hypothetical protein n=1 Tax=Clostridium sp. ZBS18 TaxID=2949967 RepID=UPI0020798076|nr:hypothetical protein [Clostridium sp. ZBS18]